MNPSAGNLLCSCVSTDGDQLSNPRCHPSTGIVSNPRVRVMAKRAWDPGGAAKYPFDCRTPPCFARGRIAAALTLADRNGIHVFTAVFTAVCTADSPCRDMAQQTTLGCSSKFIGAMLKGVHIVNVCHVPQAATMPSPTEWRAVLRCGAFKLGAANSSELPYLVVGTPGINGTRYHTRGHAQRRPDKQKKWRRTSTSTYHTVL